MCLRNPVLSGMFGLLNEVHDRLFHGTISPRALITATVSTDAVAFLAASMCDLCGFITDGHNANAKCLNCNRSAYAFWLNARRHNGFWSCGRKKEHYSFPVNGNRKDSFIKCSGIAHVDSIGSEMDSLKRSTARTLWLQHKKVLFQCDEDFDHLGNAIIKQEEFIELFNDILDEAVSLLLLGSYPNQDKLELALSTANVDDLAAWKSRLSLTPGSLAKFSFNDLHEDQDIVYAMVSVDIIRAITENRLQDCGYNLGEMWPSLQLTVKSEIELNLQQIHQLVGSNMDDPRSTFTGLLMNFLSFSNWSVKLPKSIDHCNVIPTKEQLDTAARNKMPPNLPRTPPRLVDMNLPGRNRHFQVQSTPATVFAVGKKREKLTSNSINRIKKLFPADDVVSRDLKVDANRHQLLLRPSESHLIGNVYDYVPETDDEMDRFNWMEPPRKQQDSIFDQSTDIIEFLDNLSDHQNDKLDICFIAFNSLDSHTACFENEN